MVRVFDKERLWLIHDMIVAMTSNSSNATINRRILSYSRFLKSKERAGIERAVLSNTFAKDGFGPGMYAKFVSLVTGQDLYGQEFLLLADRTTKATDEIALGRRLTKPLAKKAY